MFIIKYMSFFFISIVFFLHTNKESNKKFTFHGQTIGTYWYVCLIHPTKTQLENVKKLIQKKLYQNEKYFSRWEKNSFISYINQSKISKILINKELADILFFAIKVGKKTNGAMDITSGALFDLWGFGPKKKLKFLPKKNEIQTALKLSNLSNINIFYNKKKWWLKKKIFFWIYLV